MVRRSNKSKNKKEGRIPRGSRGLQNCRTFHDLDVPIVVASKKRGGSEGSHEAEQRALIDRLQSTGYSVLALSHTVHGKVDAERDMADLAIPLKNLTQKVSEDGNSGSFIGKKRKRHAADTDASSRSAASANTGLPTRITILRRLNVVLEQVSDVAHYTSLSFTEKENPALRGYDIIALNPRNDETFLSTCASANLCDVITLDYTAGRGGVQLPFKLKRCHVQAASERGMAFELPYGPAIVDLAKRKAFVQAAVQLHSACLGVQRPRPRIILSSGSRMFSGMDHGAMVLRTPGDLINLCTTILNFDDTLASDALGGAAMCVVQRGRDRRTGKLVCVTEGRGCWNETVSVTVDGEEDGIAPENDNVRGAPIMGQMESLVRDKIQKSDNLGQTNDKVTVHEKKKDALSNNEGHKELAKSSGDGVEEDFLML